MVTVIMRIDDEPYRLVGNAFQRRANLLGQRRELVVHNDDAVIANRDADVATRALQHVHVAGDFMDLDFELC